MIRPNLASSTGRSRGNRQISQVGPVQFGQQCWQAQPGKVVAQLMGHAKVDTTLKVYTQVIDGALLTAVDKVGSELFTIVHKPERAEAVNR